MVVTSRGTEDYLFLLKVTSIFAVRTALKFDSVHILVRIRLLYRNFLAYYSRYTLYRKFTVANAFCCIMLVYSILQASSVTQRCPGQR